MILPLLVTVVLAQTQALDLPRKFVAAKPKPDQVLATVGGVPIRAADMDAYLWDWRAYEAVQDVVTYRIIAAEAKHQNVSVADTEVQKELDQQLENVKKELQPGQSLQQLLLERGFPKSRLFLRVKTQELLDRLALKSFSPKSFVKVSTILIRFGNTSELSQALQKAEAAYGALAAGEAWDEVLSRYVDDPTTIQNHGLLGWRDINAFPKEVRDQMASIRPGGRTHPAQTQNGIQIFRVDALGSSAEGVTLQELKSAYLAGTRTKYLQDLRAKAKVDIRIGK
jgi:parvulin-like peptidyl-prolyl isomerase